MESPLCWFSTPCLSFPFPVRGCTADPPLRSTSWVSASLGNASEFQAEGGLWAGSAPWLWKPGGIPEPGCPQPPARSSRRQGQPGREEKATSSAPCAGRARLDVGRGLCARLVPGGTSAPGFSLLQTPDAFSCLQSLHPGLGSSPVTPGSGSRALRALHRLILPPCPAPARAGQARSALESTRSSGDASPCDPPRPRGAQRLLSAPGVSAMNRSRFTARADKSRDTPGAAPGAAAAGNCWCPACPRQRKGLEAGGVPAAGHPCGARGAPCPEPGLQRALGGGSGQQG